MIILCLDPGFANLGWAVLKLSATPGDIDHVLLDAGVIKTTKQTKKRRTTQASDNIRRMRQLRQALVNLTYAKPKAGGGHTTTSVLADALYIASEEMSWCRSNSDKLLGMTWGILVGLAEQHRKGLIEVPPKDIKDMLPPRKKGQVKMTRVQSKIAVEHMVLAWPGYRAVLAPILDDLSVKKTREHVVDAVACGVASLNTDAARIYTRAGQ